MVPVVLITFILFLAYYAYRRKQIDKVNTQKESDFWQRENDANSTRKQDITNLDYIQIPVDTFSYRCLSKRRIRGNGTAVTCSFRTEDRRFNRHFKHGFKTAVRCFKPGYS